jgi:prophage regulatory protein
VADVEAQATRAENHTAASADQARPRILRKPQVLARLGLSDTTLWRLMRAGKFPRPLRLSPGSVGWLADEVDAWIAARAAERG